jgi:hypothetical protein
LLQGKPGLIFGFMVWNVTSLKIYHNPDPWNFIAQTECLCNCYKDIFCKLGDLILVLLEFEVNCTQKCLCIFCVGGSVERL